MAGDEAMWRAIARAIRDKLEALDVAFAQDGCDVESALELASRLLPLPLQETPSEAAIDRLEQGVARLRIWARRKRLVEEALETIAALERALADGGAG